VLGVSETAASLAENASDASLELSRSSLMASVNSSSEGSAALLCDERRLGKEQWDVFGVEWVLGGVGVCEGGRRGGKDCCIRRLATGNMRHGE
jgi:hypothetical protein